MRMLSSIAGVAIAVYAALCAGLYLFQSRLVYFPSSAIEATPAAVGLDFEEVWLDTDGGERVHGWYLPGQPGRPAVLFCHGNAGNISHRLDSLRILAAAGAPVLIFDYPGYGRSSGSPGEASSYRGAAAAWRHLVADRGHPPAQVIVFGRSLGGGVAAWLAARERPGGLVLESSFTSLPDLAAQIYPLFPVRWLSRIRYDNRARLPEVEATVLVAHSRDDELVPFSHGRALFDAARAPRYFLEMRGGHNDGFLVTGGAYVLGLRRFLDLVQHGAGPGGGDALAPLGGAPG